MTAVPRPRRPGSAQRPLRSDSASERGPPDRTVSARPGRPGTPGRLTLPSAAFQARVPVPRPGPRPGPERLLFRILPGWTSCPPPILVLPAEAPVRSPPSQPGVLHPRLSARIPGPLPQSRPPPRSSPHPGSSPCCLPSRVPAGSGPTRVQGSARPRVPDWAPCPWRAGAAVSVTAADPVRRGGAAAAPGGRPAALSEASPSFRPPPPGTALGDALSCCHLRPAASSLRGGRFLRAFSGRVWNFPGDRACRTCSSPSWSAFPCHM